MKYGDALEACVDGARRIARKGWNGKGMYVFYQPSVPVQFRKRRWDIEPNSDAPYAFEHYTLAPCLVMFTADRQFVPWLCSMADALADDWDVVQE